LFVAGMTIVTGGFISTVFWVFPGLIVLNALSIPLAMPQMVLNLLLSLFYLAAVLLTPPLSPNETVITGTPGHSATGFRGTNQRPHVAGETPAKPGKAVQMGKSDGDNPEEEIVPDQLFLRVSVLWLLSLCFYGAQVLLERQRQAILEAREFAAREGQLHSAGRLAAEFAHQIKNPLAVISNAAYSLQRSVRENKTSAAQQIEIIQEEVARADKVITQIMGYAQLSEGRVEKLKVVEEIERAVEQVFPDAMPTGTQLKKHFSGPFPPLLMQRGHLTEILVNLLRNAREALNGRGNVVITAEADRKQAVEITVADDGPGIAPEKIERVFEA
jgi:signal transduction histidine kinase